MLARMQIRETVWNKLLADWQACIAAESCSLPQEVQRLLRLGQAQKIESKNPVGFIFVDAIGSEVELDALFNYFAANDRAGYWKRSDDGKVDFATEYTGQQDDILATQPDNVVLDDDGNEVSRTPASFAAPNEVHNWSGQGVNRFARNFSLEFGEEFE